METSVEFLKKLKLELSQDPVNPFLDIYPKKTRILISKDTFTPMFTATLFTTTKTWKQPKCPSTDELILYIYILYIYIYTYIIYNTYVYMYIIYIYIHTMKYYSTTETNEIQPLVATWIDLGEIMLSGVSQMKTNTVFSFTGEI